MACLGACDCRTPPPVREGASTRSTPGGAGAAVVNSVPHGVAEAVATPTALAAQAWTALLAQPPDFPAAAAILGRSDSAVLRDALYTVPDKGQYMVLIEQTQINLAPGAQLSRILKDYFAYIAYDGAARAKALVGLDHLLAGVMKSTPVADVSPVVMATGRANLGFPNASAMGLRVLTLTALEKLGEPAAYHEPVRKRTVIHGMMRRVNTPDPNAPVP